VQDLLRSTSGDFFRPSHKFCASSCVAEGATKRDLREERAAEVRLCGLGMWPRRIAVSLTGSATALGIGNVQATFSFPPPPSFPQPGEGVFGRFSLQRPSKGSTIASAVNSGHPRGRRCQGSHLRHTGREARLEGFAGGALTDSMFARMPMGMRCACEQWPYASSHWKQVIQNHRPSLLRASSLYRTPSLTPAYISLTLGTEVYQCSRLISRPMPCGTSQTGVML
jgi:hypothetical protein